jgi:cyclopropane fatty-acyl-phospholipid synthase-like methyltransferase
MVNKHQLIYDLIIEAGYKNKDTSYVFEINYGNKKYRRSCYTQHLFNIIKLIEVKALTNLRKQDRILDIGAGAGRISMYLQINGYKVTALDYSESICKILKKRGIKKVINADIFNFFPKKKYNVVLLVNVYSIFGKKEENVVKFFSHVKEKILNKSGELIIVLSDTKSGKIEIMKRRFIFGKKTGAWFESIHPPVKDIIKLAKESGLTLEKFKRDNYNQYFLILKNKS